MGNNHSESAVNDYTRHYKLIRTLSKGGFGTVYVGLDLCTTAEVAIKKIRTKNVDRTEVTDEGVTVPREVKVMTQIEHDNIIRLHDFYRTTSSYYLVMEYLPSSLDLFYFTYKIPYLEEEQSRKIFTQLLRALHYLHTEVQVAHMDVKLENVMINPSTLFIKLIDFGSAIFLYEPIPEIFEGTREYASPDVIFKLKYNPVHSDIWAAGVTLYRMVEGALPFTSLEDFFTKLEFRSDLSIECRHILSLMLCRVKELQPGTISEVQACPWIQS